MVSRKYLLIATDCAQIAKRDVTIIEKRRFKMRRVINNFVTFEPSTEYFLYIYIHDFTFLKDYEELQTMRNTFSSTVLSRQLLNNSQISQLQITIAEKKRDKNSTINSTLLEP